ncbi:hypothetical protein ROHU_020239 [Labeo rohita]|uniref:Secreted protein n=1 Tax=Labeo rohita TaxID=84645 RepID=A0A498MZ91_LABRO|nr:hypothetical protein ROHU_020239 [Labeo rohita]
MSAPPESLTIMATTLEFLHLLLLIVQQMVNGTSIKGFGPMMLAQVALKVSRGGDIHYNSSRGVSRSKFSGHGSHSQFFVATTEVVLSRFACPVMTKESVSELSAYPVGHGGVRPCCSIMVVFCSVVVISSFA